MSELTRLSKESEEVLKELGVEYDEIGYHQSEKHEIDCDCDVTIQHCSFLLLQWLLDRECSLGKDLIKQWGNDEENKDYGKYTFTKKVFWIAKSKDLITAVYSAVKAIKEQG